MTIKHSQALVDRRPQNLPVPLGGMAPVRVAPPRRRWRAAHVNAIGVCLVSGALCGLAGLVLWVAPAPVEVSLVGNRLEVGGMVLTAAGSTDTSNPRHYDGDASYALAEHRDGSASAAAAWEADGSTSLGTCTMRLDGSRLIDLCTFSVGAAAFTAVDILDPGAGPVWQRTYADGERVAIPISSAGAAVPVPFPVGR